MCDACRVKDQRIRDLEASPLRGRAGLTGSQLERRLKDVQFSLNAGRGVGYLSDTWNITRAATSEWLRRNVSKEEHNKLAENGHNSREDKIDAGARLEIVALCLSAGWSQAKIARAIGLDPAALCGWLKRNAPDGVDDALADYVEEAA